MPVVAVGYLIAAGVGAAAGYWAAGGTKDLSRLVWGAAALGGVYVAYKALR